jgi:plastocyanin
MNSAVLPACTQFNLEAVMSSLRFVLVSAIALAVTACGSGYSTPTPAPSPVPVTPPSSSTPISVPTGASTLGNRAFNPDTLDVAAGTTVTWTNNDSIAHTSTSNGAGWDSGAIPPQGHFSMTFANAGTFPYHCAIHPGMVGTVTVH